MALRAHTKYKLLLDEGLPRRENYPQSNNYHSLKHIVHDLGKGGASDKEVYVIANKDNRLVIVFNTKDFRPLVSLESVSVIALSTNLTDKQVDLKLCKSVEKTKTQRS